MATIYPNKKDGKIISVKLKAYLGRDEHGKQIFRCKNWIPEKDITDKNIEKYLSYLKNTYRTRYNTVFLVSQG